MVEGNTRVRFAPSPTGYMHIGSVRTALFNWLFAKSTGGKFILRIEDTDQSRLVEDSIQDIKDSLRWLGMEWDEGPSVGGPVGPYVQSERKDIYKQYVDQLVQSGNAYYCFCTPERLEELRAAQQASKQPAGYDRKCRNLPREQVERLLAAGTPAVVRLKIPEDGSTIVDDALRGKVKFDNSTLDDLVLLKSDGFPTYHLANVVDDHLMRITHVIRGDEWLPSAPRHILLYKAFGWDPPVMAHLPVILSQSGGKLSKRHGATHVREFREKGYLPEAMVNFLALLGWTSGDEQEILMPEDLTRLFSLERVNASPAVFSYEKLDWLNGVHIRRLSIDDLVERCIPFLQRDGIISDPASDDDRSYLRAIMPLVQERLKLLSDVSELTGYFFAEEVTFENPADLIPKKMDKASVAHVLGKCREILSVQEDFTVAGLERSLRAMTESLGLKAGQVFMPIRVAATGRTATAGLFETLAVLGKERVLKRLDRAMRVLETL